MGENDKKDTAASLEKAMGGAAASGTVPPSLQGDVLKHAAAQSQVIQRVGAKPAPATIAQPTSVAAVNFGAPAAQAASAAARPVPAASASSVQPAPATPVPPTMASAAGDGGGGTPINPAQYAMQGASGNSGAASSQPGGDWERLLRFTGQGGEYFWILFKTVVLSILTLGIYSFWGKTNQRKYLWGNTILMGEPLEYTGTGKELFLGFLIVLPIFIVLFFILGAVVATVPFAAIVIYPLFFFLWQVAAYRALRFRLTRTTWRGIRGNLSGSAFSFGLKATGYIFAMLFSLGLLVPWATARISTMMLDNVWFGDRKLSFSGSAKALYKVYFAFWGAVLGAAIIFGMIVGSILPGNIHGGIAPGTMVQLFFLYILFFLVLGAASAFYAAALFRWYFAHASFGEMQTRSTLTGGAYFQVTIINSLILVFTLGLGAAWVVIRDLSAKLNSVEHKGDPQLGSIHQDAKDAPAVGEGMLEALDLDIGM